MSRYTKPPPLEVKPELDFLKILKEREIRFEHDVRHSPVCIDIVDSTKYVKFASFGNFSAIVGRQKSRKTFFVTLLLAASIKGMIQGKICGRNEGKKVILFDTEQSRFDIHKIINRVVRLINSDKQPENLKVFSLKPFSPNDRIEIIDFYLNNNQDIGFVCIDGLRDLVFNINSPEEGTQVITKLNQWVEDLQIHICCVLHLNPWPIGGEEKARGHLGTELQNRSESVIVVRKAKEDKNVSIVQPKDFRGLEFKPFAFRINQEGLPVIDNDFELNIDIDDGPQF